MADVYRLWKIFFRERFEIAPRAWVWCKKRCELHVPNQACMSQEIYSVSCLGLEIIRLHYHSVALPPKQHSLIVEKEGGGRPRRLAKGY